MALKRKRFPYQSKDKSHAEVPKALKHRCGGYWQDKELGHHHAYLDGLPVAAYDMSARGNGYPDFEVWVSWLGIMFEVKNPREVKRETANKGQFKQQYNDRQYYFRRLEPTEVKFAAHHPGLIAIVSDYNQVYEWLRLVADFVLYCEGLAQDETSARPLMALFFPNAVNHKAGSLFPDAEPLPAGEV